jgi:hypothetical protein
MKGACSPEICREGGWVCVAVGTVCGCDEVVQLISAREQKYTRQRKTDGLNPGAAPASLSKSITVACSLDASTCFIARLPQPVIGTRLLSTRYAEIGIKNSLVNKKKRPLTFPEE